MHSQPTVNPDHNRHDRLLVTRFVVGDAAIELTTLRQPCSALDGYNASASTPIQKRLYDDRAKAGDPSSPVWAMGGFYASVIQRGLINTGVTIALADHVV